MDNRSLSISISVFLISAKSKQGSACQAMEENSSHIQPIHYEGTSARAVDMGPPTLGPSLTPSHHHQGNTKDANQGAWRKIQQQGQQKAADTERHAGRRSLEHRLSQAGGPGQTK